MTAAPPKGLYDSISPEEAARRVALARSAIVDEVQKVVVGQERLIELLLVSLLCNQHCLLLGVPGTVRSLTLATLARVLHLKLRSLTMTCDLTPEDLAGQEVVESAVKGQLHRRVLRGPLFCGLFLADEIDRAARKTQSLLLHAMRTAEVEIAGRAYALPPPFMVAATQNETGPTAEHPLSESQRDQFMVSLRLEYPTVEEEREIAARSTRSRPAEVRVVLHPRDVLWIQQLMPQIPAEQELADYAVDLVRASRPAEPGAPEFVRSWVDWGAGPRASEQLLLAAKARSLLKGRHVPHAADVRAMAGPVLRHRVIISRAGEQKGVSADQVVERLVQVVRQRSCGEPREAPSLIVVDDPRSAPPAADIYPPTPPEAQPASPDEDEADVPPPDPQASVRRRGP